MEHFDFSENPPLQGRLTVPSISINQHPSNPKPIPPTLDKLHIVVLGDVGVGKTSIAQSENCEPTFGINFMSKVVMKSTGQKVRLEVWDTAGQERFHAVTPQYYKQLKSKERKATGAIVVFDLNRLDSFEGAKQWVERVRDQADIGIPIVLVGNKTDSLESQPIDQEVIKQYCQDEDLIGLKCSAKSNLNIDEIFFHLVERMKIVKREASSSLLQEKKPEKQKNCKC